MNDPMGETWFSGESAEIVFSAEEMAAAEQLMQLSEEDTVSCSSITGGYFGGDKTRHEDVSSKIGNEKNGDVPGNFSFGAETKKMKKKKFRFLESIYRATKEIRD